MCMRPTNTWRSADPRFRPTSPSWDSWSSTRTLSTVPRWKMTKKRKRQQPFRHREFCRQSWSTKIHNPKVWVDFFSCVLIKCKTNILKGAPKDRSGLRLSLDLNRKRKRSSDISSIPVRSKKRPTLLLLSSTTTSPAPLPGPSGIFSGPSSSPKCAKIISKSDPISSPHKMEMFATKNVVRKINSDSDLDKVNQNQPLKFSARIRHGSAGEFNESDWLGNKTRGPCKCSLANAFFTTKPSYAETSPFKAYHVDYLTLWRKMQFMHLNLPFAKFGPILSRAIVQLLSSGLFLNRLLLDLCHQNHLISAS